jgi:L-asparaginase
LFCSITTEDNELFNAGIGSQIQSDGKIRMSAAIMDGNPRMSGVINIEEVKNPVQVAQILMQYDDRVLEVVDKFARKMVLNHFHRNSTTSYRI